MGEGSGFGGSERVDGGEGELGFHEPVLVERVLEFLAPEGGGLIVDGTVGGGGHARAILQACPGCRLVGVDRDPDSLDEAGSLLEPFGERVRLVRGSFHRAGPLSGLEGESVQGVLLDLGVSSWQLDRDDRGFTFRPGAPLDMRMEGDSQDSPSAAELLNTAEEEELGRIFRVYGEVRRAKVLARRVVHSREERPLERSEDLVRILAEVWGREPEAKAKAQVFQALRIAVNEELAILEEGLLRLRELLEEGGRMVVIAYHSLEDRAVKTAFREWSRECVCPPRLPVCRCRGRALGIPLTRRPVVPDHDEVSRNPRARSARLRAWRKAA